MRPLLTHDLHKRVTCWCQHGIPTCEFTGGQTSTHLTLRGQSAPGDTAEQLRLLLPNASPRSALGWKPADSSGSAHRRTHVPGSSLSASRSGKQRSVCNRSAEPRPAGGTGRCVGVRWDEDIPWNRSRPQLRTGWPACPGKAGVPGGTGDAGTAARRMRRAEQRDRLDSGCVTPGDSSGMLPLLRPCSRLGSAPRTALR
nr:uncharacterized protein LOC110360540 isoform X2 [Columba livia]